MADDRDRVTAILSIRFALTPDEEWLARTLLAALDTIDRTGNLHFPEYYGVDLQRCVHDQHPWPCPTELALIRGNESKGETT